MVHFIKKKKYPVAGMQIAESEATRIRVALQWQVNGLGAKTFWVLHRE